MHMLKKLGIVGLLLGLIFLAGCGFTLRTSEQMPFTQMYTNINANSSFGAYIIRNLKAYIDDLEFIGRPSAQVLFTQLESTRHLREMSLDADGNVEEYEMILTYRFSLSDHDGNELLPPTTIRTYRILPYDEDQSEAKHAEMRLIFSTMEKEVADQVVRYITSEKVKLAYKRLHPND